MVGGRGWKSKQHRPMYTKSQFQVFLLDQPQVAKKPVQSWINANSGPTGKVGPEIVTSKEVGEVTQPLPMLYQKLVMCPEQKMTFVLVCLIVVIVMRRFVLSVIPDQFILGNQERTEIGAEAEAGEADVLILLEPSFPVLMTGMLLHYLVLERRC